MAKANFIYWFLFSKPAKGTASFYNTMRMYIYKQTKAFFSSTLQHYSQEQIVLHSHSSVFAY